MSYKARVYIVNNIKLPINASFEEAFSVAEQKLRKLGISTHGAHYSVYKKSIDARNKKDIFFVYSVSVTHDMPKLDASLLSRHQITELPSEGAIIPLHGSEPLYAPPVVVGSGPCGLFAALLLAEAGYDPIILERGASVSERKAAVKLFKEKGILNINSNIQFGAGGAGTFSDGKLITRINDPASSYIMRRFVEFGAPEEILYQARPHIGTDILSLVIERMLTHIVSLGGQVMYNTRYLSSYNKRGVSYAKTTNGDIRYGALILAVGHSARDTYDTLIKSDYRIEPKSFSVGMRIEHKRDDIDRAMYGDFAGNPLLGHAEYNLSHNTKERGVYTFCMCPGGEVVAAASEESSVVVNGMSEHLRDGENSNSAVVCTIFKEDYGATPESAIDFQRKIEKAAFKAGGNDYSAPVITVGDLLEDKLSKEPSRIVPTYRGGNFIKLASPNDYLPDIAVRSIKNALVDFDKKIKGFAASDAVLTGAETRTSAPIRILRDGETRLAVEKDNIYPSGEGAGYAGGITSAAIDGLKTAMAVIKRFKPSIICE